MTYTITDAQQRALRQLRRRGYGNTPRMLTNGAYWLVCDDGHTFSISRDGQICCQCAPMPADAERWM